MQYLKNNAAAERFFPDACFPGMDAATPGWESGGRGGRTGESSRPIWPDLSNEMRNGLSGRKDMQSAACPAELRRHQHQAYRDCVVELAVHGKGGFWMTNVITPLFLLLAEGVRMMTPPDVPRLLMSPAC